MGRIKTHIKGLDEALGGGLHSGTITLIGGGAGSGKSIMSMQYLYNGIIKDKEPAAYISFEESKENVYQWMKEFGWDLAELEKKKKFVFIEYTPEKVKKLLDEGGGLVTSAIERINAKRLVLDSITSFVLLFKDEGQKREALLDLFKLMRKWRCTSIITGEFESDIEVHTSNTIEFEVDNIILMYHAKKKDTRERSLEVIKTRGSKHSMRIFPFEIRDKGVEVFPDKRVDYFRMK